MSCRGSIGFIALMAALCLTFAGARAFDETKYPDWKGQWSRLPVAGLKGNPSFDPNKSDGRDQQAPLTPEYQAILEASIADQDAGGPGLDRDFACYPPGMPRMMNVYSTMEIVVLPETTYLLLGFLHDIRRVFTDGREWPEDIEPSPEGYSIGKWIDTNGDGRYDVLEVETRGFRGLRTLDSMGLPLHQDSQTVIKERIYSDKTNKNILHDKITLIDNALTRPWRVTKDYRRAPQARPVWREAKCVEDNQHALIGKEHYMLSWDGLLMPAKKGQAAPDLRYFDKQKQ